MPRIEKPKKNKTPQKLTNLPTPTKSRPKTKKTQTDPISYYNCLLLKAQQDWYDPNSGKKQKIHACCKKCKVNAPVLNKQRTQEIQKLILSYQQVGDSLKKLLRPIK